MRSLLRASQDLQPDGLDPEEPVLAIERGIHSVPWHPAEMKAPYIYKVCLLGPCHAGKSSLAHRLVAHTFDPNSKPTRAPSQLFWRHLEKATGKDIMMEIEDTPGVQSDVNESGELTPAGLVEVEQLLRPLVWFERRRRDKPGQKSAAVDESAPLVSGASKGRKVTRENAGFAGMQKSMNAFADNIASMTAESFGNGPRRPNPIGEDRKRQGFVIVADVSSSASFETAYAIIDRLFARLQFDTNDPMTCPVSIVIVGNKSDLRGRHRQVDPEEDLRREILHRYENKYAVPPNNVLYVECSAQTNAGLEQVMLLSLERIRSLPTRHRIRTTRLRATGSLAQCKRAIFGAFPCCFEIEEFCKLLVNKVFKPIARVLGLYSILCECVPLIKLWRTLKWLWSRFFAFRWLCDWCPPFVLRLRKEATVESEDADADEEAGGGADAADEDS